MRPMLFNSRRLLPVAGAVAALCAGLATVPAHASSHREAPFITSLPKVDGADFYMFRSYEATRSGYVTLVATYNPLQAPGGAPNYFTMDADALYEIHVDNNGDGKEDITFQFRFTNTLDDNQLTIGGKKVSIPLVVNASADVTTLNSPALNVHETYTVSIVRGDRRTGTRAALTNAASGASKFDKPVDNIGNKTISAYPTYAAKHVYDVKIPGCADGRLFVGQRKDPFQVNLGELFDLINIPTARVIGSPSGGQSSNAKLNITSLQLEVPIACLTAGTDPVIGAWTTASLRQGRLMNGNSDSGLDKASKAGGAWTQVSRLGMPLVNEVVIGLKDKDKFNGSKPFLDAVPFGDYVTNPTFPALVEALFTGAGVKAPTKFPRSDLVAVFLTGVAGVNKPASVTGSEMLRLNTALPVTAVGSQNSLGAAQCFVFGVLTLANPGCDPAGFPNGRRPGDDIVDIVLRVAMGYLLPLADAPSGQLAFTDGALNNETQFDAKFPYLKDPLPGSPNGLNNLPPNP